ncbi:hypothetical protein FACS18949_07260 [Clostridia bacterium]|nr:hypothetical protein FACS18949_07260 [Clostridia bacterium]
MNYNTIDWESEISREIPPDVPTRYFAKGTPILTAFDCALLERQPSVKSFVYTALCLKNGKTEVLARKASPLSPMGVNAMVEKMSRLPFAGASARQVDRAPGERLTESQLQKLMTELFTEIFPKNGLTERDAQIKLAERILSAIAGREILCSDVGTGTGKSLAYLVPAVLSKRGRMMDFWNGDCFPGMSVVDAEKMPIVVATSSIALQKALIEDYIPKLSRILMMYNVITKPLTAVLRKGREHYLCEHNLKAYIAVVSDQKLRKTLEQFQNPSAEFDLGEISWLPPYIKRVIGVSGRCVPNCPYRAKCRYMNFREAAQHSGFDIQVCNHQYLIADAKCRSNEQRELIPAYQSLIIDEAHKFLDAARSMYGTKWSSQLMDEITTDVYGLKIMPESERKFLRNTAVKMKEKAAKLFKRLKLSAANESDGEDERENTAVTFDTETEVMLYSVYDYAKKLAKTLNAIKVSKRCEGLRKKILYALEEADELINLFRRHGEHICWLADGEQDETLLCALPKDLDRRLCDDIWKRGVPTILTSGTLSVQGNFTRVKQTLGLDKSGRRQSSVYLPSPFDYRKNALLYLSKNVPFPDPESPASYIRAVADEVERLVQTSRGRAAVLFTSYDVMGRVHAELQKKRLSYPMLKLERGSSVAIEQFKSNGKGVLLASGSLWEGIDIPGDALSMLIIVKLPFQAPNATAQSERARYADSRDYLNEVLLPDMLIKLRQGAGRLIRTETDTGVIAILDCRANERGAYFLPVTAALPDCRVTSDIGDIDPFLRERKPAEYFE